MRVIFFGNSASTFSNRLFDALSGTEAHIVGAVDVPRGKSFTTTKSSAKEGKDFV